MATQAPQFFDLNGLVATQPSVLSDFSKATIGSAFDATVTNLQGVRSDKPLTRIYCKNGDNTFVALIDGKPLENLVLKGHTVTLVFRGINVAEGKSYPKFSVLL